MVGGAAPWLVAIGETEFRGDHRLVAPGPQRPTEEHFGLGVAIEIGRVEQRDPGIKCCSDDGGAGVMIEADPEEVAADSHDRDIKAPDAAELHRVSSPDLGTRRSVRAAPGRPR